MAERSAVERALRAELAESRALIAELRLQCELYADQVATLRELERKFSQLEREWSERDRLRERENRLLGGQVAQLQARLGRNSRNSNTPPSAEGYTKPPPRSSRRSSGRKSGGQPGAPGATLAQVGDPDEVVVHSPSACAGCGRSLAGAPVTSTETRQVADLPEVALRWVEHRIEHRGCGCGATTMAGAGDGVPESVRAPVSYGPGVRAVATYLVAGHHLPLGRAAAVMSDLLGAPVSAGSVAAWVQAGADGLGPFTDAVRQVITAAPVVNFDETGLRVGGGLGWVHSASTPGATLYTCHPRRGTEAMDAAGVLPAFTGIAVHDCWKPYWCYPVEHALCNAHVARELAGVFEATGQTWAPKLARILQKMNTAVRDAKDTGATALEPGVLAGWQARIDRIVALGWAQNPEPAGGWPAKRPVAVNLLDRFQSHRTEFLRFATDFRVPYTNNAAEQAVRPVKIRQKISGCMRTMTGAQAFCALRSYLATGAQQGRDALVILHQLHQGQPWLPAYGSG